MELRETLTFYLNIFLIVITVNEYNYSYQWKNRNSNIENISGFGGKHIIYIELYL